LWLCGSPSAAGTFSTDWLLTSVSFTELTGATSGLGGGLLLGLRAGGGLGAASSGGGAIFGGGGAGAFPLVRFLILGAGTGGTATKIRRV